MESVLIDFLTYPKFNLERTLTHVVSGHHQWDEGIKTVDEIRTIYDSEKIDINPNDHLLLLVSLNRSFDDAKSHGVYQRINIYEKTRKYWAIAKTKACYVLGVYRGVVRAVIKVNRCEWSLYDEEKKVRFNKERCIFHGYLDTDSSFLNKDVTDYLFGSGGAIRYISADDLG